MNEFTEKNSMYEVIVIGVSAGGVDALSKIIPVLPKDFPLPVIIVQHRLHDSDSFLSEYLDEKCDIQVKEAMSRETIKSPCVYIAPSGYHLLIEGDKSFSLSVDPPVNYSIPAIDVLFESAAAVYEDSLVGVVLTGANSDGSKGLKTIKDCGGLAVVQDPETAESSAMPKAAIKTTDVDHIIPLDEISQFLIHLNKSAK